METQGPETNVARAQPEENSRRIKFSSFDNQYDTVPKTQGLYWWEFVELFSEHQVFDGDKTQRPHFNGCEFHTPYRKQDNVEAIHLLVLDYDDGLSIDQARDHFKEYEHIGYTSYNHQVSKGDKSPVDKYRVIIPLATPCPGSDWMEIRHNVANFAPEVDMASVKLSQPFAIPIVRTGGEKCHWHNKGKWLDVSDWEPQKVTDVFGRRTANPINRSQHVLKPDDIIRTKSGTVRVGDVNSLVSDVFCPFHDDNSPTEFINKSEAGNVYLVCKHCGTIYMEDELQDFDVANWLARREIKAAERKDDQKSDRELLEELLVMDDAIAEPFSQERRGELIKKYCGKPRKRMLLYAFEGFGKSHLAVYWAQQGQKIVFGCSSNAQAHEQAESFRKAGCRVQAILSREYRLETQYGIQVDRYSPSHPWDQGKVNENSSKANMMKDGMSEADADQLWDSLETVGPDLVSHDIVVTTHARIQSWGRILERHRQRLRRGWSEPEKPVCSIQIPPKAVVVFDDPGKSDFMRLADFDNAYADARIDGEIIKRETIDKHEYFVKPSTLVMGYGFRTQRLVFTTTELVTSRLIHANYEGVYEPKLMPDQKMLAGDIHLLKTELVRKKMDGILPPIMERVKKEGYDIEYIADGQGNQYNLSNSKGQNVFISQDTVIELSQPHEQDVIKTQHELGWENSDKPAVRLAIALDQVHQAIGRNSGYRWSDLPHDDTRPQCIVLCEPHLFKALSKTIRYCVTSQLDVDEYSPGFRKRQRDDLLNCVIWFLQNYSSYICNGLGGNNREFQSDAKDCLLECPSSNIAVRKKRMLDSLSHLHGKSKGWHRSKLESIIDTIAAY